MAGGWDRASQKAKAAWRHFRLGVEVGAAASSPALGPVAQQAVQPITTYTEYHRQLDLDRQKNFADWQKVQLERNNDRFRDDAPTRDPGAGRDLGRKPADVDAAGRDPTRDRQDEPARPRAASRDSRAERPVRPERQSTSARDRSRDRSGDR